MIVRHSAPVRPSSVRPPFSMVFSEIVWSLANQSQISHEASIGRENINNPGHMSKMTKIFSPGTY